MQNLVDSRGLTNETIFAYLATFICGLLGGWDGSIRALVFFIVIDYVTGFLGAWKQKKVDSEVMFWGGIRKGIVLAVVAITVKLDALVGNSQPVFRTLALYFYIAREGVSIIENLGVLNVPIPGFLTKVLTQLQDKSESKGA